MPPAHHGLARGGGGSGGICGDGVCVGRAVGRDVLIGSFTVLTLLVAWNFKTRLSLASVPSLKTQPSQPQQQTSDAPHHTVPSAPAAALTGDDTAGAVLASDFLFKRLLVLCHSRILNITI